MLDFARIVFPTDFSKCSDHALDYAVFLAERFESELHMLHALVLHTADPSNPENRFPEAHSLLDRLEKVVHSELGEVAARSDVSVLKVRHEQRRGMDPGSVILDYAREVDAGLLVMGTHGRRGARRLFLGSVAENVLRRAACPVLLVREAAERTHLEGMGRILVPVDFSDASRRAIALAAQLAGTLAARLRLIHVIEIPALPSVYGQPMVFDTSDLRKRSLAALEKLAAEAGASTDDTDYLAVPGHPATEIVAEAERIQAGMIVMPPHSRGRLEHFLTGRTTEVVVRTSPCPVLTTGIRAARSSGGTSGESSEEE